MQTDSINETKLHLTPKRNCFVAHFDILGMKALIERDLGRAWSIICDLHLAQNVEELPLTQENRKLVSEHFFSDTLVLITKGDSTEDLITILIRSLEIFRAAFEQQIPLRGGIAYGEMISSSTLTADLFTGCALSKAHYLGESQQMLSIVLDEATATHFWEKKPFHLRKEAPALVKWDTPFKNYAAKPRTHLNWPALCYLTFSSGIPETAKDLFNQFSFDSCFDTVGQQVQAKYVNTLQFIRSRHKAGDIG